MTLEFLQEEMKTAMKSGEKVRKDVLSNCIGAIKKMAIDKGCREKISEDLILDALRKEEKMLVEQLETCPSDREVLRAEFLLKLNILREYLPQLISDPEIIRAIIIGETRAADLTVSKANKGKVMKLLMPIFKGKYDMKMVNIVLAEEGIND